jgi:REP element-mobilizing transposase RayT
LVAEGLEKFPVDLIAYQWMSNHWHMVLSPQVDGGMSALIGWITLTHTQRYHAHHGTTGYGHVYQGRYKSFPVQDDDPRDHSQRSVPAVEESRLRRHPEKTCAGLLFFCKLYVQMVRLGEC